MPTDAKREYNREYYRLNKNKWAGRTPEKQAEYNANRRRRYATSSTYREKAIAQASNARIKNPERRKLTMYGLESDQLEHLTNGGCAICGADFDQPSVRRHIDHDHRTGQTRGVLCQACNLGLGHFQDDPIALINAAHYLMKAARRGEI